MFGKLAHKLLVLCLLQVHCKRHEILCKRKKERKKEKKERKKKSMISMPRSSSLSSKKGERRYLKTSTTKFFTNSSVRGSVSRSKVALG
jgi:hypothetical protein